MSNKIYCKCGGDIIKIDHYEPDGVTKCGSYEPFFECVFGCESGESVL